MKANVVVLGSVAVLVLLPLAVLWYRSRRQGNSGKRDRMDEKQHVKKRKEKIVKNTSIKKEDVRFVIGKRGCVIKDIESRCGVKISFPETESSDETATLQTVVVKGDCNDDITEAIDMVHEACQLKPKIITETIEIRAEYCGKIIGKGGENLKDIREHSGTRILINKEPVDGNEEIRICSIEGTKEEIEIAKRLIDSNVMTEIEIRRRREHRQAVQNYQSTSSNNKVSLNSLVTLNNEEENIQTNGCPVLLEESVDESPTVDVAPSNGTHNETVCEALLVDEELVSEPVSLPTVLAEETSITESTMIISTVSTGIISSAEANDSAASTEETSATATTISNVEISAKETCESAVNSILTVSSSAEEDRISVTAEDLSITKSTMDESTVSEEEISVTEDMLTAPEDMSITESVRDKSIVSEEEIIPAAEDEISITADDVSFTDSTMDNNQTVANHSVSQLDDVKNENLEIKLSSGFNMEMSTESSELFTTVVEFDKVRTDLSIDEDVKKVDLKDKEDFDPNSLLDSVCLPPLSPDLSNQGPPIESNSFETVIAAPLSSVLGYASNGGTVSTTSSSSSISGNLVNEEMTLNLKSMLGINKNGGSLHADPVPDSLLDVQTLFECSVYSFHHGQTVMAEEFEGIVTSAKCCNHVWVVNRQSDCLPIISKSLSAYTHLSPLSSVKMNRMYLFMDKSVGVNCRVFTLQHISKLLVECYDVDTGVEFTVPVKCLSEIPDDLSGLPPAAVCVSIGSGACVDVASSDLIGQVVTVTPQVMGANKEIKYPRVKLHRDQIVYNNYRPYVSSPKPTETASLPSGSSLVYVSAIHNAGHFYVQACGKNISELDRLESAMAQHYGSVETLPEYSWDPVPGQMCGVWHTSEQIWLRGQIKELDNSDMLYIKYLDYGDTVHLPRSHTRKLRSEFMELPYQAIECFLANTIPITTRQWTPDATAKFDALTQCGQWYPLRCVVVGERHGKPCVELYDQPYSDKEYSVGECLCAMEYARSSKMEVPAVQTLSTPIPSFASGAAYLVSPDFDDVDDELEELFACDDDSDSADSDDFPMSRANVSNLLLSLGTQISPQNTQCKKNHPKYRPQTCGQAKNNAFMERRESTDSNNNSSEQTTPQPQRKNRFSTQESSTSDSDNISESDQSNYYETPLAGNSPKSTTSSYASAADFNNTFVAPLDTPYQTSVTPLHLSSAEDTDCG